VKILQVIAATTAAALCALALSVGAALAEGDRLAPAGKAGETAREAAAAPTSVPEGVCHFLGLGD
jgi:hypothetical protein